MKKYIALTLLLSTISLTGCDHCRCNKGNCDISQQKAPQERVTPSAVQESKVEDNK